MTTLVEVLKSTIYVYSFFLLLVSRDIMVGDWGVGGGGAGVLIDYTYFTRNLIIRIDLSL